MRDLLIVNIIIVYCLMNPARTIQFVASFDYYNATGVPKQRLKA